MRNIKRIFQLFMLTGTVFMMIFLLSCSSSNGKLVHVDFRPGWDTTRVLSNPGKGWYHHLIDNGIHRYEVRDDTVFNHFPGMDHVYFRLAWSFLEPEEGKYDWSRIDKVVNKYVPQGYGVSFRISSKERGGYPNTCAQIENGVSYATPVWVRKAGAKGVEVVNRGGVKAWCPDWDDPVYLEKLNNFHHAFAERYDGKPWVRYVDIGSIGDYGEGHTSASTKVPPTVEEVKANIDVFLKNYKHSLLVAVDDMLYYGKPDEEVRELYDYAVSHGITIRDDSPMVGWYIQKYMDSWTISHPQFYDPLYLTRPTVLELAHYTSVQRGGYWLGKNGRDTIPSLGVSGAEIFRHAIEVMHATYIGYHGYAEDFLADNPELSGELLNVCGYWYFPVSGEYPSVMRSEGNAVKLIFMNKGVAPAYQGYSLVFRFDSKNGDHWDVIIPDAGNRSWIPGEAHENSYTLKLPENMTTGKYTLKFKLRDNKQDKERDVTTGVSENTEDEAGFVPLGKVKVRI